MSFKYEVVIKEHHLDSYGHVNNANYMSLYEEARWEAITSGGYGYKKVQQTGFGPVVLGAEIKFLKELKLRETITITVEMLSAEGKIFKIKQQMLKADQEVASEAIFTAGFFDLKNRKLVLPTEEWLKAIELTK
ncbi:acyl-CoA thioesterase [Pseudobdellovibrio exovorus]|uniref:Thioesterase n=1 Tax=Pseudobdellovibrio exovorus JSS TaxID=1184267 RepID=M4VCG2_9BACT|nr:acyl-CoA thioesterase [Pseudobdellovibrio exovorus]AGH96170.1 hypothetical protein A11Q_1954 [Pseudobdellovibrio exovorus JSS]